LRFNRETQADRAAKNFAKKQVNKAVKKHGKKAAKAAGKAASAATKKIVAMLASALGGPVGLVLFAAIFVLILLPSMIFGSGFGTDSKYDPDDLNNTSVGSSWEDDAELAIEERYKDLKIANFWGDLGTFFTTGHWGQAGARFETEFANAKDADEQGTDGYFSSSNRLIAIINEAFRLSLKNSRIENEAKAMANQTVAEVDNEIRTSAATRRPDGVHPDDYHVEINIAPHPSLSTEQNFIYESCYALAAASGTVSTNDTYATGVRETLDKVFSFTGLDWNLDKEICWEASVTTEISELEKSTYTLYSYVDELGMPQHTRYPETIPPSLGDTVTTAEYDEAFVKATIYYAVTLSPNYKDIINERCGIEDTLPADTPEYETTQEEQVNNNALELAKFYGLAGGGWAEIGEVGLPLPRDSYSIYSRYGWRILYGKPNFHEGVDLQTFQVVGVPIYAVKDGVCTVPPFDGDGYGNYVTMDHGDGIQTRYGHMSAVAVSSGQSVKAGEIIGFVGSTGNSTGPHLHFEIIVNGTRIDPLSTELGPLIEDAARGG
jgi:murein DD-endopeptidase MepM/ murein hydrolase activator NlpD